MTCDVMTCDVMTRDVMTRDVMTRDGAGTVLDRGPSGTGLLPRPVSAG